MLAQVLIVSYTYKLAVAGARARASPNAHRAANANGLYAANRHLFRQVTRHIAILLIIQIRVVTPCLVDVR